MSKAFLMLSVDDHTNDKITDELKIYRTWFNDAGFEIPDTNPRNVGNIDALNLRSDWERSNEPSEDVKRVLTNFVPYLEEWSRVKAFNTLKTVQNQMATYFKAVFANRQVWKQLRFLEIHMAEEFLADFKQKKYEIITELEEKANTPNWLSSNGLLEIAFKKDVKEEDKISAIEDVITNQLKALSNYYLLLPSSPFQTTIYFAIPTR
jgi:hypothetical protein